MNNYSIKKQIVIRSILAIAAVLFITIVLAQLAIVNWLNQEFDTRLLDKANILTTLTKEYTEGVEFDFADEFMPEFEAESDPEYFQIWLHGGDDLLEGNGFDFERSRSLKNNDLPRREASEEVILFSNVLLPDGQDGRLVQRTFIPQIPEDSQRTPEMLGGQNFVTLVVAMNKEPLLTLITRVRVYMFIGAIVLISVIGIILYKTITAGFHPVKEIQLQLARIKGSQLNTLISLPDIPQEMDLIIQQLNLLFKRMEESLKREKTFSANAAHELRTPISELYSITEIEQRWPNSELTKNEFYENVLAICREMSKTVDSLLLLAKADNNNIVLNPESIDLVKWVPELIDRTLNNLPVKPPINIQLPKTAIIEISPDEFQIVVSNLLANAFGHNFENSQVLVVLDYDSQNSFVLTIANKTYDLEEKDLEKMFGRLWRKDNARTSTQHSGLGLSLVKTYADLLDLEISTNIDNNHIFKVTLSHVQHK